MFSFGKKSVWKKGKTHFPYKIAALTLNLHIKLVKIATILL